MAAASVVLLLGVVGLVAVIVGLPFAIARARRSAEDARPLRPAALVPALALGVLLVVSVAAIVGAVILG